jgi:UDP-N-acetylmuramate--alanine ligase
MISPQIVRFRSLARHQSPRFSDLQFSSAHLVGIGGTGMKALAELLVDMGWSISGSDLLGSHPSLLAMRRRGLRVHCGHDRSFLPQDSNVLVYSPAVGPTNPERRRAAQLGIPEMSYSQMLGWLMQNRQGVAISGTHGKSTTTAMVGSIATDAGLSPAVVVGAELCRRGRSAWGGSGKPFIVEACEYRRSFLDLRPTFAAILGIETDHFDVYSNLEETIAAFSEFASRVAPDGMLLVRGDCEASKPAAAATAAEVVTFSMEPGSDWWASDVRRTAGGTRFRTFYRGAFITEIFLQVPGVHNVLNALAATALCSRLGVSAADIRESLAEFRGVRRRFEIVGTYRGTTLIDDYAHHPTAVRATLATAREQFPARKIWCVFQPHQVSRVRALLDDFAASFTLADELLVAPVFAARESAGDEALLASAELASGVSKCGCPARFLPSLDRIVATLEDEARPGDVVVIMGAGDIDRVHHELTGRVRRHRAAG